MANPTFGDILNNSEPSEEAPEAREPEATVETGDKAPAQPRNPDGKFARKGDGESHDEGAPPAPVERQEYDGAATIAERRKRQEAEQRLAELQQQLSTLQQQRQEQPRPAPPQAPDMFEDPDGYTSHLQSQFQQALYQQSFQMSDRFARQAHGDDAVNAALEWGRKRCDADPYFNQQVMSSGDPVGYAVREYQRNQIVENVSMDDYAKFKAWQEAQAQQPAEPPPARDAPPTLTGERNLGKRGAIPDNLPSTFGEILNG